MSYAGTVTVERTSDLSREVDTQYSPPALPTRIPSLDGLRAISIAAVFVGHSAYCFNAPGLLRPFHHFGNLGVRFFFVISGFLITTLLVKELCATSSISLRGFYGRRALRIFPASMTYIAIISALTAVGYISIRTGDLLSAATYTANYHAIRSWWVDHLWSLSVEEQFYLLWPGAIFALGLRRACRGAWAIVLLIPVYRAFMWLFLGAGDSAMTKHFEACADALGLGCLLAVNYNRLSSCKWYMRLQQHAMFIPASIALIGAGNFLFFIHKGLFYVIGQSVANIGTCLCIDWCIRNPHSVISRALNLKPVQFVGALSYSLYLWQNPFLNPEVRHWSTALPYNIVLAFLAAWISYKFVEIPFLKLKSRLNYRVAANAS